MEIEELNEYLQTVTGKMEDMAHGLNVQANELVKMQLNEELTPGQIRNLERARAIRVAVRDILLHGAETLNYGLIIN